MKQIKLFLMMLLLATVCLGFNACSSDDDDTDYPTSLVGTVWKGTNPENNYKYEVNVTSETKAKYIITTPSNEPYETTNVDYIYNSETGKITLSYYGSEYTAQVKGNKMIVDIDYTVVTLTRQ